MPTREINRDATLSLLFLMLIPSAKAFLDADASLASWVSPLSEPGEINGC